MNTKQPTPGVRHCARTGQYFPTLNGADISPSSFSETRALQIAQKAARCAVPDMPRKAEVMLIEQPQPSAV